MSDRDRSDDVNDDLDVEGLDPDDTREQLHPSAPLPSRPDPADDDFAEEPAYEVNDG